MRYILYIVLAAALMADPAFAAKPIGPPMESLYISRNIIAVAHLDEIDTTRNKATFTFTEALWGDLEERLELNVPSQHISRLSTDRTYIVAYSHLRKHPMLRDEIEKNPNGPTVIKPWFVGPAVFTDSPELRQLFARMAAAPKADASKTLDQLFAEMGSKDRQNRRLSVFEFFVREDLYSDLTNQHQDRYKLLVNDERLDLELREMLLRSAQRFPENKRQTWIAEYCREKIMKNGAQYDLQSFVPLLMRTCVQFLNRDGKQEDFSLLATLIGSNNPGVSKAAIQGMRRIDEQKTVELAEKTLKEQQEMHLETRRVLQGLVASG